MEELRREEEKLLVTFDILKKKVSYMIDEKTINEDELERLYVKLTELDSKKEEIFQEELNNMSTPATALEQEKNRLEGLIGLIENRILCQKKIYSEYSEVIGKELKPTPNEERDSNLNALKNRLEAINEYISNRTEVNNLTALIEDDRIKLTVALTRKKEYDNVNLDLNGKLYACLSNIIKNRIRQQESLKLRELPYSDFYDHLNQNKVSDEELYDIKDDVKIFAETLSVYKKSKNIDKEKVSRKNIQYYDAKEKLLLFDIYTEILINDTNNEIMTNKRKKISDTLDEIRKMRVECNVSKDPAYDEFKNIVDEQSKEISVQSQNENNIDFLNTTINNNLAKIEALSLKMNTGEIVGILQSFNRNVQSQNIEEPIDDTLTENRRAR